MLYFFSLVADRPVGLVVKDTAIGAVGFAFDSRAGQIGHSEQLATAATFLRSCVARR